MNDQSTLATLEAIQSQHSHQIDQLQHICEDLAKNMQTLTTTQAVAMEILRGQQRSIDIAIEQRKADVSALKIETGKLFEKTDTHEMTLAQFSGGRIAILAIIMGFGWLITTATAAYAALKK